jgi:hypothetical protein
MQGGAAGNVFVGILIVIVVLYVLYFIYNWLYSSNPPTSVVILNGSPAMTNTVADPGTKTHTAAPGQAASIVDLSGVVDGGEYSATFWVYVASTSGFIGAGGNTPLAHLMEISNDRFGAKGKTLVFVGLNPVNASLVVRQSTTDAGSSIDNTRTGPSADGNVYPLSHLIANYNSTANNLYTGGVKGGSNRCDIVNGIEYQRWVLVGVVGNGRVLDVYIDGKLARSCAYSSPNSLGSANGTATAYFGLGNGNKLKGYFSNGNFYNYALTPANMWSIYQDGPAGPFSLWNWMKSIFTPYNTASTLNSQTNPNANCPSCSS